MAELQAPDADLITAAPSLPIPTDITPTPTTTSNPACTGPPPPPPPPPPSDIPPPTNKRQRRPSVRLGEIGDSPSETHFRRGPKTWRYHKDPSLAAKTSKTRPLTNLDNNYDDDNLDLINRKSKKPAKRVRTSWHSTSAAKFETSTPTNGAAGIHDEDNYFRQDNNNNNNNDDFREFDGGSESPLKEHSPINSMEQHMGLQYWDRTGIRSRVSESRDHRHDNGLDSSGMDKTNIGVRDWLIGLGLGRYAPLFDIHEVDDEVLPMLTLEDLKDMGINAVGSRRKMYNALLKLRKGFS